MSDTPFLRYQGTDKADPTIQMPADQLDARLSNLSLSEVIGRFERFIAVPNEGRAMYPWASRFVMGFPLPEWQRPFVWTQEQQVRFIQSIWTGVDLGSYMVNDQYEFVGLGTDCVHFREFSEVLLDGQQRLATIQGYLLGEFAVPDVTGTPRYWHDLPLIERRRFGSRQFARANIRSWDEQALRQAYDLRAFGGTPHTEAQKAS